MRDNQIQNMSLYNSDFFGDEATKVLEQYTSKVDLVLTDPAYNIADKGKVTKSHGKIYSNKEAWGNVFKDSFTPTEYNEFTEKYLKRCLPLLVPGGSAVIFIDRKYAGQLVLLAEKLGYIYKNMVCFMKMNAVPKIRAFNYASAFETAVWLMKPRSSGTKTKPLIFNYTKPTKNLRHSDGKLDVVNYHNTYSSNVFFYNIGKKIFGHPTEKYCGQIIPMLETHSNKQSLVLDPFGGSFAIGYYANQMERKYIGFEVLDTLFDKAISKMNTLVPAQEQSK